MGFQCLWFFGFWVFGLGFVFFGLVFGVVILFFGFWSLSAFLVEVSKGGLYVLHICLGAKNVSNMAQELVLVPSQAWEAGLLFHEEGKLNMEAAGCCLAFWFGNVWGDLI